MTRDIDALVFDLGGVLIDWNPRHLYRRLFGGDDAAMERFLAEVCSPAWNAELDSGRSWHDAVESLASRHPAQRELIVAYDRRWPEMLGGPVDGMVELLAEVLRAGLRIAALSNWSAEKYPIARDRYDFLGWFEVVVISGEVGLSKPDPRIYRLLFERTGFDPASTLFVDDAAANTAAAERLGVRSHCFRDPVTLRIELLTLGILPKVSSPQPPGR